MRNVRTLSLLAGAALLAGGCGGSHPSSSARAATKGKGRATLTVTWPQSGRVIPYATGSLVVTLTLGSTVVRTVTVDRPAGQNTTTQTIDNLPYGTIAVAVKAYSGTGGAGGVVATGGGSTTVADGQPGAIDVNMASSVARVATATAYYEVQTGTTKSLTLNAFDSTGAIVLLSSATGTEPITWTLDGLTYGSFGGSTTATGVAVDFQAGTTNGVANVAVSLQVGGQGTPFTGSCKIDVNATGDHSESALLDVGFPTPRGLAGNLGRGSGNAATGTLGTATPVIASGAVGAKVVDGSGNLYAAVGTTLRAFKPDGTDLWSAPVMVAGGVKDLALTKDGRLYAVGTDLVGLAAATGTPLSGFGTFSSGTGIGVAVAPNGDVVYASSTGLSALSPVDHSLRWSSTVVPYVTPAVDADGTVYVRTGAIVVINGATGATIRSIAVPNNSIGGIAVRNGVAVVASYASLFISKTLRYYTTTLYAFNGSTGTAAWSKALATNAPALGGVAFALTSDGGAIATSYSQVHALSPTGVERAGWPLTFSLVSPYAPSVSADDTVYFTIANKLYAYGLDAAKKSWSPLVLSGTSSAPSSAVGGDGKVYVGLTNGTVVPVN